MYKGDVMNPCETAAFVTAAACSIFKVCDSSEIELLALMLTQLGDTLVTMLASEQTKK